MRKLAVVGSINMDVVNRVERHPQPGETIHGLGTAYSPGGKGANQAVAAARAGAQVCMVGAVGDDAFGPELRSALQGFGVDTRWVAHKPGSSGLAFITVASSGENNIILSAGANGRLTAADVEAAAPGLRDVDAVLLQNEIPWSVTQSALQWAHQFGKRVFLNPAPARRVGRETLSMVDVLVLNETEAQVITGIQVDTPHRAETACQRLLGEGCQGVVLTLGSNGLVYQDKAGRSLRVPAFSVEVVDTTAAGDTFIGALAAIWEADADLPRALRFASAAAALTVTRAGAQESIPERGEIESFLSQVSDAEHTHLPG
ncbi:ribokinase [Alicyclobacillus shizuokensis]|uniref:ribokinase n=1 Tax=Alicyclobacillus shizuokensis TaxID=392014 RepID=UPI00082D7741|nr:ribokinase [Alicyclobacillus shizuokensis]